MNIKIVEVTSKSQLDEYIRLPELPNSKNNIYFGSTTDDALEIHNAEKNVL
jgi:hypothetical protein